MNVNKINNLNNSRDRSGIVLLVTLVLLVVLATLGYTLSSRVAAQRHRNQYVIDYSKARYGCESAVKYALATLEEINPELIERPNEPDFSDLFALSEAQYQELLEQWRQEYMKAEIYGNKSADSKKDVKKKGDIVDINHEDNEVANYNFLQIRGPYGPSWPFVAEPVEFEIGSAQVRIEIEDENAKYPLGWALLNDEQVAREAATGFEIFCEWMKLSPEQVESLKQGLTQIGEIKPFEIEFKQITKTIRKPVTTKAINTNSRIKTTPRTRIERKTTTVSEQVNEQTTHFAKLFHSSFIDIEDLARPTLISEDRKESALKYMGIWGTRQININTAPRHVLEAAFVFGGDEVEIADQIIQLRRQKPFTNIEDLKKELSRYSDAISKCEKYITTVSNVFTIRITSTNGIAKASSVIAIIKDGDKVNRIAVING